MTGSPPPHISPPPGFRFPPEGNDGRVEIIGTFERTEDGGLRLVALDGHPYDDTGGFLDAVESSMAEDSYG